MLQNLTNFFNLITNRKIKTTLKDNDLIAVGTRDSTWVGNYQPTAISYENLEKQIINNVPTISLTTSGSGGSSTLFSGVLNIPVYQTRIPHLEWNDTEKTIWNNCLGNDISNTGFGEGVLKSRTSGSNNTGFGYLTLWNTSTGSSNTGFGTSALRSNSTGSSNTAFGTSTLLGNTTGSRNTAIGSAVMFSGNSSIDNTAVGYSALQIIQGANYNVAIGSGAMLNNTFGSSNIGIGYQALPSNTTGQSNIAIGQSALQLNSIGSNNIALGPFALAGNSTGNNNTAIGYTVSSGNFSGSVILGREAAATANNQFVVGSPFVNAGAITAETITPNTTWTVRINGANYKIPLLLI